MKNSEQAIINKKVNEFVDRFNDLSPDLRQSKRLRSCQARVYIYDEFYLLKSYNTMVAGIDRKTGEAFDFLRLVYGYTATSSQHINKFFKDYGWGKWYPETVYTYRPC